MRNRLSFSFDSQNKYTSETPEKLLKIIIALFARIQERVNDLNKSQDEIEEIPLLSRDIKDCLIHSLKYLECEGSNPEVVSKNLLSSLAKPGKDHSTIVEILLRYHSKAIEGKYYIDNSFFQNYVSILEKLKTRGIDNEKLHTHLRTSYSLRDKNGNQTTQTFGQYLRQCLENNGDQLYSEIKSRYDFLMSEVISLEQVNDAPPSYEQHLIRTKQNNNYTSDQLPSYFEHQTRTNRNQNNEQTRVNDLYNTNLQPVYVKLSK